MSVDEALRRLLVGTGLTFSGVDGDTIALQRISQSGQMLPGVMQIDPVRVQASMPQSEIGNLPPPFAGGLVASGQRVGLLGERDYMNTPFSVTTYTEKYLEDQQAVTLTDAVAADPSIRAMYPTNGLADWFFIRGFTLLSEDMSFNGLYGVAPYYSVNMAGIERVEVFRGPTALLNGMAPRGAVGGTINLVPKRAGDEPLTRASSNYMSNSQVGGHIDVGRRFGPDKVLGLRANAYFTGGDTPVANQNDNQLAFSLGFDYRGEDTRIDADLAYSKRWLYAMQSGMFVASGVAVPPPPAATSNFYQPWGYQAYDSVYGMARFEHDITPAITVFAKAGARRANANFIDNVPTLINTMGTFTSTRTNTAITYESISAEAGGRAGFNTGGVRHEVALSASTLRNQQNLSSQSASGFVSNIWNPVFVPPPTFFPAALNGATPLSDQLLTSIAVADNVFLFDDRLQLILGGRAQQIQVSNYAFNTGLPATGYNASALTPAIGFIARPWRELSFYGNYIQALQQGSVVGPTFANAGTVLPPFMSSQFELGLKLDLGNFGATLSAFQITRPSTITNAATNTQTVDGQQVNKGLELILFGEPLPGFKPLGGITLLDPRQTQTAGNTNNGKMAPGVSNVQLTIGADWDPPFLKGFGLMGRVIHTSMAYLDAVNTQPIPAWTRFDVGARYTFERADGKPVTIRANVINLFEMNYWMAPIGVLTQGPPRTFMLSLASEF